MATLKIETVAGFDFDEVGKIQDLQERVKAALKAELNIAIVIKIVEPHTIQRSEGKAVRIVDLRD